MNSKLLTKIIGIILGVAILIIGFSVQGISVSYSSTYLGRDIKFGADFYTEMYAVTRDVGRAVDNNQRAICRGIESVCSAIGWLIVAIGLVDIAFFTDKLFKVLKDDKDAEKSAETPAPSAAEQELPQVIENN